MKDDSKNEPLLTISYRLKKQFANTDHTIVFCGIYDC